MMRYALLCAVCVRCMVIPAVAAGGDGPSTRPDLTLTVQLEPRELYEGETAFVRMIVENVADHDVVVPVSWHRGYIEVTLNRWTPTTQPELRGNPFRGDLRGNGRITTMRPGQKEIQELPLWSLIGAPRPGRYRMVASYQASGKAEYGWDAATDKSPVVDTWAGKIFSEPVTLTIKPLERDEDRNALQMLVVGSMRNPKPGTYYFWPTESHNIKLLKAVRNEHPDSIFAKYCDLFIAADYGNSQSPLERNAEAITLFKKVAEKYPRFHLTDDALLGLAKSCLRSALYEAKRERRAEAVTALARIVKEFPDSDSFDEASELLKRLRAQDTTKDEKPTHNEQ